MMKLHSEVELALSATKQKVANCTQVGRPGNGNPAGPEALPRTASHKADSRSRGTVRHSKPGRPSPVADFAATDKAYPHRFRPDNRQNSSENSVSLNYL